MRYLVFLLSMLLFCTLVQAGPDNKWVYVGQTGSNFDAIALILGVGAFIWFYIMYRDFKSMKHNRRK